MVEIKHKSTVKVLLRIETDGQQDLKLTGSQLPGADLSGLNLTGSDLRNVKLTQSKWEGANFKAACLSGASLDGANLQRANFVDTIIQSATFVGADLRFPSFRYAKLNDSDFHGADLTGADLSMAKLRVNLQHAVLVEAVVYKTHSDRQRRTVGGNSRKFLSLTYHSSRPYPPLSARFFTDMIQGPVWLLENRFSDKQNTLTD